MNCVDQVTFILMAVQLSSWTKPLLRSRILFNWPRTGRQLSLAYNLHEPSSKNRSDQAPLIILHGLFGSKQNNRGLSKYVHVTVHTLHPMLTSQGTGKRTTSTCIRNSQFIVVSMGTSDKCSRKARIFEIMAIRLMTLSMTILPWPLMSRTLWETIKFRTQR